MYFKTQDFTKFIFAGEVPPNDMLTLLTDVWKVGPNLSMSLLNHFGGHIWDTYNAISELKVRREDFEPTGVWDVSAPMNILETLETFQKTEHEQRVRDVLKTLAIDGFVPLTTNPLHDPVARKISEKNIGGVVKEGSVIVGLPESVWNGE